MSYSGQVAETRQRILETARELFNRRGLARVGVRDVARAARMSPGNLAYHFPTRDALIAALVMELHQRNGSTLFAALPDDFSLVTLYRTALAAMRSMLGYRFILLSYVEAVTSSRELERLEERLSVERRRRSDAMMALMVRNGYLVRRAVAARADRLYEQGQMISSGWLAAAALRPDRMSDREAILHYAKLGCALLEPVCTPSGHRQLRRILGGGHDERED
jgi:AcrR family transcriptional regulator